MVHQRGKSPTSPSVRLTLTLHQLFPHLQTLPHIRTVHIRAVAPLAALTDLSAEQDSLLLAHELASCVRHLVRAQETLETLVLVFTPCVSPIPWVSFDAYEATLPCGWAKNVLVHRVDVRRYRNSAPVVTCGSGTLGDRRTFMKR